MKIIGLHLVVNPRGAEVCFSTRSAEGGRKTPPHDISGTNNPIGAIQTPFDSSRLSDLKTPLVDLSK